MAGISASEPHWPVGMPYTACTIADRGGQLGRICDALVASVSFPVVELHDDF